MKFPTVSGLARLGGPALFAALWFAAPATAESTGAFAGVKVNGGTVSHEHLNGRHVLTLSPDFQAPDTPDPHWQVVDSTGNTYLLQRVTIKNDRTNRSVELPTYVRDVARVQMWCAWAETLLGEAAFARPVITGGGAS